MRRFTALFFHILVGYLLGKFFVHFGQEKGRCENHKFKGSLNYKVFPFKSKMNFRYVTGSYFKIKFPA